MKKGTTFSTVQGTAPRGLLRPRERYESSPSLFPSRLLALSASVELTSLCRLRRRPAMSRASRGSARRMQQSVAIMGAVADREVPEEDQRYPPRAVPRESSLPWAARSLRYRPGPTLDPDGSVREPVCVKAVRVASNPLAGINVIARSRNACERYD